MAILNIVCENVILHTRARVNTVGPLSLRLSYSCHTAAATAAAAAIGGDTRTAQKQRQQ